MRHIGLVLLLAVAATGGPAAAGVGGGGTPEIFLRCSTLHNQKHDLKSELADMKRRSGPVMADQRQALSEVDRHEAEAKRLEKIAAIMRSSDDMQSKYNQAVRRYNEALDRYNEIRARVEKLARVFDDRSRARKSVAERANAECAGTWNGAILTRFCGSGDRKHRRFCATFADYRDDPGTGGKQPAAQARTTGPVQTAAARPGPGTPAPPTDCDRLAAHPDDPGRPVVGVVFKDIDGGRAVRSCTAAIAKFPREGRFHAYLSRAYDKTGDNVLSMRHARKSAALGHPFGFHYVSLHYMHGMGVPKDPGKELEWKKAAAMKGLPVAMTGLGIAYRLGKATAKDLHKAAEWLRKAIDAGYATAYWELGLVYEEGIDGKPDLIRAAYHLQLAVEKGIKQAGKALARVKAKQAN